MFTSKVSPYQRRFASGIADPPDLRTGGRAPLAELAVPTAPPVDLERGRYRVRLADTPGERDAACRLRFRVFNVELGGGFKSSYAAGMDQDKFDLCCDHLIVEDRSCNLIVGTYRMQPGPAAARNLGYYGEREFDFSPYENIRDQVLELGRASIDREHRTSEVLTLLWRGIARYARFYGLRYLIGCSSLNSRDPREGWSMFRQLENFLVSEEFRTRPTSGFQLAPVFSNLLAEPQVPRLLKTYIAVGAGICGAPAWDRDFGTIDFLTLLDLEQLAPAAKNRFLPEFEPSLASDVPSCSF